MPKERLHILLAHQSLQLLAATGHLSPLSEESEFAWFLGSIFPDVLFYDFPSFGLSGVGGALHRLQGEVGLPFFKQWLDEEKERSSAVVSAWILGVCSHYLADGFWHPHIERLSSRPSLFSRDPDLSPRDRHLWIESELEAHWMNVLGPRDGYLPLLGRFQKEARKDGRYTQLFRELVIRSGLPGVPSGAGIARCLFLQTVLLRQFGQPTWAEWKPRLLARRFGHYLGSLLVPIRPVLPSLMASPMELSRGVPNLCSAEFMAQATSYTAGHLRWLLTRS